MKQIDPVAIRICHHGDADPIADISSVLGFHKPVIDHASLLIKGPGAAGTGLHQDRPYWTGRETTPTIVSMWIALEVMSEERGGLMLCSENEVRVNEMASFNTGDMVPHDHVSDADGGFPILIRDDTAAQLADSMAFVDLPKGGVAAFDSFEPHMTGPNQTQSPRLAMKIAYAEANNKTHRLTSVEVLENTFGVNS